MDITLEYLKTLEDPTLPLPHALIIEKSISIDITKGESVSQLLAAMADRRLHHAFESLVSKASSVANELNSTADRTAVLKPPEYL